MKKIVEEEYKFFLALSIMFGIITAFCLYKNDAGITYPFLIIVFLCEFYLASIRLGLSIKKDFLYYAMGALILSISICTTDDSFVQFMDKLGILILIGMMTINQSYEKKDWKFFSCLKRLGTLVLEMLVEIASPVLHWIKGRKKTKNYSGKEKQILIGISIGIPLVFVVIALFIMADQVFKELFIKIIKNTFFYPAVIELCFLILIGIWFFYTLFVAAEHREKEDIKQEAENEPIIAITFLSMLTAIYLLFCFIQIMYLFAGGVMKLPDKFSYAEYARRGFFELLFVSLLNFTILTICLKKFKDNKILRIILTIFSICTFILIFSSAYRMILYIRVYHLTFQRVLVLWFLTVLTIWMIGAVWQIYQRKFVLFRYIFLTSFFLYVGYAFMGESKIIAKYNLSQIQTERSFEEEVDISDSRYLTKSEHLRLDLEYLVRFSACDIAPILLKYSNTHNLTTEEERILKKYFQNIITEYGQIELREYNFARKKAYQAAVSYFNKT